MEKKYNHLTISFVDDADICRVLSCDKDAVDVVIPRVVDNHLVIAIKDNAFKDCKKLKSVTFEDVDELPKALYMPSIDYEIGSYAFSGCSSLKKIHLPKYVKRIGRSAFYNCTSLKSATFHACDVDEYAFSHCELLKKVSKINDVREGVFSYCKSLEYLPIGNKASYIGEEAFYHCYGLTDITIPKNIIRIEGLAFRSCYNMKSITFEKPNGWKFRSAYTLESRETDFSDPVKNVKLAKIDFDDGVIEFYRF